MRFLFRILALIFALFAIVFALDNRQDVTLGLWPFTISVEMPLYLVAFVFGFAGLIIGLCAAWTSNRARRKKEKRRQKKRMEKQALTIPGPPQNP